MQFSMPSMKKLNAQIQACLTACQDISKESDAEREPQAPYKSMM